MPSPAASAAEPSVSVIMPTHDRPGRLQGALQSILAQTYRHLEVIVVDDASDPPAQTVVAPLGGDPRLRVERLPGNVGAAGARNAGLALATGEFVAFLDDDDRWEPTKVELQVGYLKAHPEAGLVTCGHFLCVEGSSRPPLAFRGPPRLRAEHLLWANFAGSFSFVMARRRLLGDELRIDESFPTVEDWDLWLRCSSRAGVGVVPRPLVRYVFHDGPRLTDALDSGLERFCARHAVSMSPACLGFHRAHQLMQRARGRSRRLRVAEAIARAPAASAKALVIEQVGRQLGRLRRDPGLMHRALARHIDDASTTATGSPPGPARTGTGVTDHEGR